MTMTTESDVMADEQLGQQTGAVVAEEAQPQLDVHRRRQAAFVAIGRRAIAPPAVPIFVQDAASLLAESLEAPLYGVTELIDRETLNIKLFEVSEDEKSSDPFLEHQAPLRSSNCISSYALETARPVACGDVNVEMRFKDNFLKTQGIASALVSPLILKDRSYGAICVFDRQTRQFTIDDVQFVETLTHLVTTAIAREQAERALQEERRFNSRVLETIDALVLILDADGFILKINRACQEVTGFSLQDLQDRSIFDALLDPNDLDTVQGMFKKLRAEGPPCDFETSLLTKDGRRRQISWSYTYVKGQDGQPGTIIGTGVDVTEQRDVQEELVRVQSVAAESSQKLNELITKLRTDEAPTAQPTERPFQVIPEPRGERRGKPRRSYPYVQLVAAITVDGQLPDRRQFKEVECRDIGAGGFSYLSPTKPPSDRLVVALGTAPSLTYLTAAVAHLTQIDRDGQSWYIVGCRYTGRATYS